MTRSETKKFAKELSREMVSGYKNKRMLIVWILVQDGRENVQGSKKHKKPPRKKKDTLVKNMEADFDVRLEDMEEATKERFGWK